MDNTSQTQAVDVDSGSRPTKAPVLKHLLIGLAVPLIVFLAGIYMLSVATLIGLIVVIVAIAITVGILMAAWRMIRQSNLDIEPAQWKTKTFPLASLILIVGLSLIVFFIFSG